MSGASIATVALWVNTVGTALMAGTYFTFSAFVMRSLAAIPRAEGVAAMQSINRVIVGSPFLPVFVGTSLASLGLAIWGVSRWGTPGALTMVAGGVVYVLGMFVCTAAFNVPLNDALDAVEPASAAASRVWDDYLRRWTFWNHVRTLASTLALVLFVAAIVAMRGAPGR